MVVLYHRKISNMSRIRVTSLNRVPALYSRVLELQKLLFAKRKAGTVDDTLLVLQHSPVYTMGKRGSMNDLKSSMEEIQSKGIEIVSGVSRGGETTYHGPGQIVVYPIINLRSLGLGARKYVESLEDAMIDTAAIYGLSCQGRVPGKTGVWLDGNKIGAVGVAISGGVSYHGISFNASPDLSAFRDIVACGDTMSKTTSLEQELKPQKINLNTVATQLSENIITRLGHEGEQVQIGDIFDEIDRYV